MAAGPRRVFISHIHEELRVAAAIAALITAGFKAYGVAPFVSSDRQDLPAGRKWLSVVEEGLRDAEVLIAVLSHESVKRPWPNIELGAAWFKGITVIPS